MNIINTKEIIYNNDNLNDNDINKLTKRAKLIVENNNEELLLVFSHNNYFLLGGHVLKDESFDECIIREVKEESGIEIPFTKRNPFLSIIYLCKDYPTINTNTKYISNYYSIKYDLIPDLNNLELTEDEKDGNFKLEYINKEKVIDILNKSIKNCTKENVVTDTIKAIEEYLKS